MNNMNNSMRRHGKLLGRPRSVHLIPLIVLLALNPSAHSQAPSPGPDTKREDLGKRLIRKAVTEQDEDVMGAIIRLMTEAAGKLELKFDPGEPTQHAQKQAIAKLDEAIQTAAARTKTMTRGQPKTKGDKRTRPEEDRAAKPQHKQQSSSADDRSGKLGKPSISPTTGLTSENFQEWRRAWGQLPMRERDEVLQGASEKFSERYRIWIEKYYRALQESDE